jgi:hypothetical protein
MAIMISSLTEVNLAFENLILYWNETYKNFSGYRTQTPKAKLRTLF